MPLTHDEILRKVSSALAHASEADSWIGELQEAGILWDGATDVYEVVRTLEDLERDLTSDLLQGDMSKISAPTKDLVYTVKQEDVGKVVYLPLVAVPDPGDAA